MGIFIGRMRTTGVASMVGFVHPSTLASQQINPILQHIDNQYNLVSSGNAPRTIPQAREDEGETIWDVNYKSILSEYGNQFQDIVNGIKNGTLSTETPQVVQNMYSVGQNYSITLCHLYLRYALLYEIAKQVFGLTSSPRGVLDDPYASDFHWTDYLKPWNWGKSPFEIEMEKKSEQDRMRRRLNMNKALTGKILQHEYDFIVDCLDDERQRLDLNYH